MAKAKRTNQLVEDFAAVYFGPPSFALRTTLSKSTQHEA